MMKDLSIMLKNQPGALARLGTLLGNAGINIEGIFGTQHKDQSVVHILVDNPQEAQKVLEKEGIPVVLSRDVLVKEIEDTPGALGKIAQKLADAGINIDLVYLASRTRLVLGVDDLEKAAQVL